MTATHRLVALPSGKTGQVAEGTSLRTALREMGVGIESLCAENATCGKCKILVEEGPYEQYGMVSSTVARLGTQGRRARLLGAARASCFMRRGWNPDQVRLACQARILGDVVVTVPEETRTDRQIVRKTASMRSIEIRPSIRKYLVELTPPSLDNPKADWDRLASGLATSMALVRAGEASLPTARELTIDRVCLQNLPAILRQSNWRVTASVWQDHEVIHVEPGLSERLVGAALDIGTTTLALYVCDLTSGDVLAVASDLNPQIEFGGDVMSRIQYCSTDPTGLEVLHKAIIKAVNQLLVRGAADAGISTDDILELVMVGQHDHAAPFPQSVAGEPGRRTVFPGHLSPGRHQGPGTAPAHESVCQRARAAGDRLVHRSRHNRRAGRRGATSAGRELADHRHRHKCRACAGQSAAIDLRLHAHGAGA